jgi:RNA polymerase sigma factor FliA
MSAAANTLPDLEARLTLVKSVLHKLCIDTPRWMHEDIYQSGCMGMIQAVERWDGERDFTKFASSRIWGEGVEAVRKLDYRTRRMVKADHIEPRARFYSTSWLYSAESGYDSEDDLLSFHGVISEDNPAEAVETQDSIERMKVLLETLPVRQATMLRLHYCDNITLKEVGRMFGVTEARACQITKDGLRKIRERFDHCSV